VLCVVDIVPIDVSNGSVGIRMDFFGPVYLLTNIGQISSDRSQLSFFNNNRSEVYGHDFTFSQGQLTGGAITRIDIFTQSSHGYQMTGLDISVPGLIAAVDASLSDATPLNNFKASIFGGDDHMSGSDFDDVLFAYAGNDTVSAGSGRDRIESGAGQDSVGGGAGDDTIVDTAGTNYLRGDDGDDSITGGIGFDDINGNMGNDTCVSGGGDDWVVGGKDNDSLVGSAGANLVYGNIGADTCDGGDGNDIVRGGQDNDLVNGGAGDDFVSGDKGDDTVTGGAGADIFHTFGDAGMDRVTDFSLASGDRVMLDPGTQFTVSQVGADTVINMSGGGQMTLVGVTMSTLTGNWIFGA
jgi:Ca2+-binding RTX toxin-like protein